MNSKILGMSNQAATRKVKRSFTLSRETAAYVTEVRHRCQARSDSEALDMVLRDAMTAQKKSDLDAAVKAYYDNATDEELREQEEWAKGAGASMFLGIPE